MRCFNPLGPVVSLVSCCFGKTNVFPGCRYNLKMRIALYEGDVHSYHEHRLLSARNT